MKWLVQLISGPMLWAVMFSLVYGLHGWVCADLAGPEGLGDIARMSLVSVWILGLIGFVPLLRLNPGGQHLRQQLPRIATWIGLSATVITLFPVAVITSC